MPRTLLYLLLGATLVATPARAENVTALLDTLQHSAFDYFWYEANPANGLIKDRSTTTSPASIAAVGFGLSAICIGVDHGWVTRTAAANRVRVTLETFWTKPQGLAADSVIGFKGLFYHFLDMNTGYRVWNCELSSIDTGLLLAGILDAREYFTGADTTEVRIRALADSINRRVDWNFMRNFQQGIMMGFKPGTFFSGFGQWVGYNEAMIMYLLALGSPTYPVPANAWSRWTSTYTWGTQYGQTYILFPPLFGHQYSHCWVDFRHIQDDYTRARGITYFENSRRATLAQRAYCAANPLHFNLYSDSLWGITAGDGFNGYAARGAPPAQNDDGTITPTATISSMPFAPVEVLQATNNLWNNFRSVTWGPYGFGDGFNPTNGWIGSEVIGIDQGPIILMIENHRTGKVWQRVTNTPEIQLGLQRAGFTASNVAVGDPVPVRTGLALASEPNPFHGSTTLRFDLPRTGRVRLAVFDVQGREVALLVNEVRASGAHSVSFGNDRLPNGVYHFRLDFDGQTLVRRGVRLN